MTSLSKTINLKQTVLLVAIVVFLAVIPLFLNRQSEFGGADTVAKEALVANNVQPWFKPLWEPPGSETESLLFAMQAGFGAGIIGYFFGYKRGLKASKQQTEAVNNISDVSN